MSARYRWLVVLALAGCGESAPKSPETAVKKLLEAAASGDANAFREGFPSQQALSELFDCPADIDVRKNYDGLSDEFVAWRNARPSIAGAIEVTADVHVGPGERVGPCGARVAMHLVMADVPLSEGGAQRNYQMRLLERDGVYRVLAF